MLWGNCCGKYDERFVVSFVQFVQLLFFFVFCCFSALLLFFFLSRVEFTLLFFSILTDCIFLSLI